jgi:hypothetical protein
MSTIVRDHANGIAFEAVVPRLAERRQATPRLQA